MKSVARRHLTLLEDESAVLDLTPRLGIPIIPDHCDDQTPDEQHATQQFLAWRRGDTLDFPSWFNGIGGDAA